MYKQVDDAITSAKGKGDRVSKITKNCLCNLWMAPKIMEEEELIKGSVVSVKTTFQLCNISAYPIG